jgi:hypothetical protein
MAEPRRRLSRALAPILAIALAGCIDSGNHGWDFGGQIDPQTGAVMSQAWRGVHGGRIGFRCREDQLLLFVESWHPLRAPPGQAVPMEMGFRFDVGSGAEQQRIQGMATSRGIEIPAPRVGEGAPNPLLAGLTDGADELVVTLPGERHQVSILFDVDYAANAHEHVAGGCGGRTNAQQ